MTPSNTGDSDQRHQPSPRTGGPTMKALLTLDGSDLSATILPTAQRVADLVGDVEFHVLRVLDPGAVKGTWARPTSDARGDAAGTMVIHAPRPRVAESRGEAEERVHFETLFELKCTLADALPNAD